MSPFAPITNISTTAQTDPLGMRADLISVENTLSLFCEIVNLMVNKRAQEWRKHDPNTR